MADKQYDVIKHYEKVPADLVAKYATVGESASVHEAMGRKNAFGGAVKPVWPGMRLVGPALTVQCRPGDNFILHVAIDLVQPGDVIVVAYEGDTRTGGMWGGLMSASAMAKGAAGLLTDGATRDSMVIKRLDWPVFSAGHNVTGTTKVIPGTINHPVNICGVTINPGDLIFADNDDVVVVPREKAAEVYELVKKREDGEEAIEQKIFESHGEITTYNYYKHCDTLQRFIENGQMTVEPD